MASTSNANSNSISCGDSVRALKHHQQELPNLLLSTTYAINKSSSKKAIVGLEYHNGSYRPILKLGGGGSPSKYVTLDSTSWEFIVDQMDTMEAYLKNSFTFGAEFGSPIRIYLQTHDIHFGQAYGSRAITIDERPTIWNKDGKIEVGVYKENTDDNAVSEPPAKKKKYDTPPSIAMQLPTFEGLRQVRQCINYQFEYLTKCAVFVNHTISNILTMLKSKLPVDNNEIIKRILKDSSAFKNFYSSLTQNVDDIVLDKMEFFGANDDILRLIIHELSAFCLPMMAKDLYEELCEKIE